MMAHELQHAVEIAETPAIVDGESLVREYKRIGYVNTWSPLPGVAFDTQAAFARRTGDERLMQDDSRVNSQIAIQPRQSAVEVLGVGN